MLTTKETMKEIIDDQPDDSSFEEILRELLLARMIRRGLDDADHGRTITDDEMKERIERWRRR